MKRNVHIHDYQPGVIHTYRDAPESITYDDTGIFIKGEKCGEMQFCYSPDTPVKCSKRDYLESVPNSEERLETVYETKVVFDRATYENGKKYQDKVKRWLNYFEKHGYVIRELTEADKDQVNALYKEWYTEKELDEPMIRRYQNCIDAVYNKNDSMCFIGLGMFNSEGRLVGFRTLYKADDGWAYDLSNSVTRHDYNYLSEVFQVNTLKYLMENHNVEFYNLGLSDGSLRLHKTLLPNFDVAYYVVR